jgi:hypothetical protein
MRRLRRALGPKFPIVVTHDFHANLSQEIVDLTTALLTYQETPHVDTRERGLRAARIMAGVVSGKVHPTQALAKPPMLFNIRYQNTSVPPWRPFLDEVGADPGRLRIAFTAEPPIPYEVEDAVIDVARDAAEALAALGHEVVEQTPPWTDDTLLAHSRAPAGVKQAMAAARRPWCWSRWATTSAAAPRRQHHPGVCCAEGRRLSRHRRLGGHAGGGARRDRRIPRHGSRRKDGQAARLSRFYPRQGRPPHDGKWVELEVRHGGHIFT